MFNIKFKLLILSLSFLFAYNSFSQETEISGIVMDRDNDKPLEFSNIALLDPIDSAVVAGATANIEGEFIFNASQGDYILRVGYIGYEGSFKSIEVKGSHMKLGILKISSATETLEEVTVTGVTSMFESDIDKRTYNVENSILADGATASQLLNSLPSIQMDEEGGISMRGSGSVQIFINGRPTNLSSDDTESILAQFPANSIKSVELITNPSSRYDAQGSGGIINILLKKDERLGFNGQANVAVGTRNKYQTGININYGTEKLNMYASYNYQYRDLFQESESLRRTTDPGSSPFLDQDFFTKNYNQSHLLRGGFDYSINENAIWGVYGLYNHSVRDRNRVYNQRHQNLNRNLDSLFVRNLTEDQFSTNIEVGTTLDIQLDSLGQEIYASLSYAKNQQERTEFFDQLYFNNGNEEVPGKRQDQIYGRPEDSDLIIAQIDYTKPLSGEGRIEAGYKGTFSIFRPLQTFEQLNLATGEYVPNDTIANQFNYDEYVHAGYGIYRSKVGRLGYQAGLRAEQTFTTGLDFNSGEEYVNDYFNLFPSLYVTYELRDQEEFLVNYSRRINRPGWGQMAPFYNAQDLLNTRFGNPQLLPEFTDSYEAGYNKGWDKLLFTGTVYHRRTTNAMTRIFSLQENNTAVQLWENADFRRDTGLELINQFDFHSNLDATLSGNFFYSEVNGENLQENFYNSSFSWTLSLLSNWSIPNVATFQLMADYRGPIVLPQGEVDPIYGVNIGVRREVLNNRATLSLNISDIFNTRVFRVQTEDVAFSQMRFFNQETRIGTLSFTYRFGGFKSRDDKSADQKYSEDPF